ncbi:hypothetical protein GF367_03875 [Candidatus Woesearchaeota archaeon]|nr:hypothetical protein [Candidatus Woesearchaeota archaeon]
MKVYQGLPAEEELYRAIVDLSLKAGANMLFAKVNAVLFLEPRPLSLEAIAEKTGYSLASVSTIVKQFEMTRKAHRIKKPGSKKIYVQGEKNFVSMLHQQFKHIIDTALKPMQDLMPRIIKELKQAQKDPKTRKEKKEELKKKIQWYEDYLEQNHKIVNLFNDMEQSFKKLEHLHR